MAEPAAAALGSRHEQAALDYLLEQGLTLLQRNYRCRLGEIELVMEPGERLVFVEVRYRSFTNRFPSAIATVGPRKQQRLARAAAMYLAGHHRYQDHCCRFDVIGVDAAADGQCELQWVQDAFRPEN